MCLGKAVGIEEMGSKLPPNHQTVVSCSRLSSLVLLFVIQLSQVKTVLSLLQLFKVNSIALVEHFYTDILHLVSFVCLCSIGVLISPKVCQQCQPEFILFILF